MEINDLKTANYRSALSYLIHDKILLDELKKSLNIELSGDENIGELYYLFIKNITKPKCICGNYKPFIKFSRGYRASCGNLECLNTISIEKRIETCQKKYGGNSPANSQDVVKKMKATVLEKYGIDGLQKNKDVIEKKKKTNLERYGVEWSSLNSDIIEKTKKTNLEKYGVTCPMQEPERLKIIKENNLEKFGHESIFGGTQREKIYETWQEKYGGIGFASNVILEKINETNLKKYGFKSAPKNSLIREKISTGQKKIFLDKIKDDEDFEFVDFTDENRYILKSKNSEKDFIITKTTFTKRRKNNISVDITKVPLNTSIIENEIIDFIKLIYDGEIIIRDKKILDGKEIDIFLPELNIGFELNGIYWHCEIYKDNNYHINKTSLAKNKNIDLFHIFEDEWLYKKEIIKSIIRNKIKKNDYRFFARKCVIRELTNNESSVFLNNNHIQGNINASIKIGLYYNDILVSVMTFSKNRISTGGKSNDDEYEMLRFANILNSNVIGGANKMFKYFLNKFNPKKVISFSDVRLFTGNNYNNMGFKYIHLSKPNYWYIIDKKRKHRFSYRKDKLIKEGYNEDWSEHKIMLNRNIYRIYDCGNMKWEFTS